MQQAAASLCTSQLKDVYTACSPNTGSGLLVTQLKPCNMLQCCNVADSYVAVQEDTTGLSAHFHYLKARHIAS